MLGLSVVRICAMICVCKDFSKSNSFVSLLKHGYPAMNIARQSNEMHLVEIIVVIFHLVIFIIH